MITTKRCTCCYVNFCLAYWPAKSLTSVLDRSRAVCRGLALIPAQSPSTPCVLRSRDYPRFGFGVFSPRIKDTGNHGPPPPPSPSCASSAPFWFAKQATTAYPWLRMNPARCMGPCAPCVAKRTKSKRRPPPLPASRCHRSVFGVDACFTFFPFLLQACKERKI